MKQLSVCLAYLCTESVSGFFCFGGLHIYIPPNVVPLELTYHEAMTGSGDRRGTFLHRVPAVGVLDEALVVSITRYSKGVQSI